MKSYYLIEHDHATSQFSIADHLQAEMLDVGDCYTTDPQEVADLEAQAIFPQFGWYWSQYDKASKTEVDEVHNKLSNLLFANSINPKSFLERLKGNGS